MPIYEYVCKKCDHMLDALQKISDDPLSAPRFRLKGAGWYETDFKNDNQRNVLKSDSEPAKSDKADAKSDKTDTKKTEKKTESKKASKADSK